MFFLLSTGGGCLVHKRDLRALAGPPGPSHRTSVDPLAVQFLKNGLYICGCNLTGFVLQEDRLDPMIYIFPRMTKCTFHKFGPSGEVEKHDALCILPLNIVNEKIYIFIWFW